MPRSPTKSAHPDAAAPLPPTLERLLAPLADLCIAKGISYGAAAELLKRAFVHAARAAPTGGAGKRDVSRVSTATGLTRREVARITGDTAAATVLRPSPATQVFTRWMGSRSLHDKRGRPRPLRRQGAAPSFESLARSVTRDVHPRSLLAELCRLGLVQHDEKKDVVIVVREAFVPQQDQSRMLQFLANNVGDHFAAAVSNVLAQNEPHLEQAIFADELSPASLTQARKLVRAQWKVLLAALVPEVQALIDADRKAKRVADQRLRVGLYSYTAPMSAANKETKGA